MIPAAPLAAPIRANGTYTRRETPRVWNTSAISGRTGTKREGREREREKTLVESYMYIYNIIADTDLSLSARRGETKKLIASRPREPKRRTRGIAGGRAQARVTRDAFLRREQTVKRLPFRRGTSFFPADTGLEVPSGRFRREFHS